MVIESNEYFWLSIVYTSTFLEEYFTSKYKIKTWMYKYLIKVKDSFIHLTCCSNTKYGNWKVSLDPSTGLFTEDLQITAKSFDFKFT